MPALDQRLLRRARPARLLIGADILIGLTAAVLVLLQATLLAVVVSRAFGGVELESLSTYLVLLALVFAGRGLLAWMFEVAGRRAATAVLSELRRSLVARRLRRSPAALDGVASAEIAAASVAGLDALDAYFARYLPQVVLAFIVPVAVLVWVAAIDIESAIVLLVTLPLVPIFMWLIGRHTERKTRERWAALRLLSTHFLDVVRGLPTLRAFNRGRAQATTIGDVSDAYRRATMRTLRTAFLSGSVLELAATLGIALVAVTAGVRLVDGSLGLQAGVTVLVLAPELYLPLRRLGAEFHASADGVAVADTIFTLLDRPAESPAGGSLPPPSPAEAALRLEQVSFAYPVRPGEVLSDVVLELAPGATVALVGETGSGKSTICALLLRFMEPSSGRITVGGVDLAQCDIVAWRQLLAWVPQRPALMHGGVAENIRLADSSASDDRVIEAARLAGADKFIRALPHGYETVIGDGGRPVSVGERRRIALARAFLRDAPLVILDEPTADLDPASAELIRESVQRLSTDRTLLLVTHDEGLPLSADLVVRLDHGKIVPAVAAEVA